MGLNGEDAGPWGPGGHLSVLTPHPLYEKEGRRVCSATVSGQMRS